MKKNTLCTIFHDLVRVLGCLVYFNILEFILTLLSPYLCSISSLYLDLYVLGDDALIS